MRKLGVNEGLLLAGGVALILAAFGFFDTEMARSVVDATLPKKPTGPGEPPTNVPMPMGWQRYEGPVTEEMTAEATHQIAALAPLGSVALGGQLGENSEWAVFVEWHYHPTGQGFPVEGWHHGASIIWRRST